MCRSLRFCIDKSLCRALVSVIVKKDASKNLQERRICVRKLKIPEEKEMIKEAAVGNLREALQAQEEARTVLSSAKIWRRRERRLLMGRLRSAGSFCGFRL